MPFPTNSKSLLKKHLLCARLCACTCIRANTGKTVCLEGICNLGECENKGSAWWVQHETHERHKVARNFREKRTCLTKREKASRCFEWFLKTRTLIGEVGKTGYSKHSRAKMGHNMNKMMAGNHVWHICTVVSCRFCTRLGPYCEGSWMSRSGVCIELSRQMGTNEDF